VTDDAAPTGGQPNQSALGNSLGDHRTVDDATIDEQPVEIFLERFPPAIRATGRRLRELIRIAVPQSVEGVRSGWSWIGYGLPDRRAKRTFAWVGPERKHIHLGFQNGILLADPERLLHGAEERLKQFRYLTFEPKIDLDEAILIDFLRRSADLAVMPAAARRALAEQSVEPAATGRAGDVPADWELVE
jgi:hypothetical protein